ncbi:MAG TPA: diaminobutyrate--2-oxoglutarate transaminase, partial [Candidatus Binataceae bacterium]|nr:diaminobutyrate--2-oxoglutarate transaminase [Candidatus Binataceae bacterium]
YLSRQDAVESNARTYARKLRLAITRARGVMVEDADGRTYYDCLAGAGTLALGHNHPFVLAALHRAIEEGLPFQTLDLTTPVKDAFTEALLATLPEGFRKRARIQFCSPAGTDAIEAALKLVMTATGRRTILVFRGGYHGMTQGALGLMGNLSAKGNLPGLIPGGQFLPYPYSYRCPFGVGGAATARLSAAQVRSLLDDPEGGVLAAGLLTEIVQGEGGVIPAPDEWILEVRSITKAHSVPLIFDEVQTGWGRTGRLYAFEHSGMTPDVLVLSKAIGGGLPLAVIIYDQSLDVWNPGAHAGTFRGNQLAMAAGLATLRIIQEEDLASRAAVMGERMQTHLRAVQAELPFVGDVRGRGLMIGAEIVNPEGIPDSLGHPPADGTIASSIQQECLQRGLILELGGRYGAVARFLPPLIISRDQVDSVCEIFREACLAVHHRRVGRPFALSN